MSWIATSHNIIHGLNGMISNCTYLIAKYACDCMVAPCHFLVNLIMVSYVNLCNVYLMPIVPSRTF